MHASIKAIDYHLPETALTTQTLSSMFPQWSVAQIDSKTGISSRHIAGEGECASDLAFAASQKLFRSGACHPKDIDFVLMCTQSPDYLIPTTACLLQHRLGISTSAGALDINLGCSGYVYGLGLAEGLILSGQASSVLFITADTYSKYLDPEDKSSRVIFGDAGTATLIDSSSSEVASFGPFVFGTDGGGAADLILLNSGTRRTVAGLTEVGHMYSPLGKPQLHMNGSKLFAFAMEAVPRAVHSLLAKSGKSLDQIDRFVFHQANKYMLDELQRKIGIPSEKFQYTIGHCGNTVSSTIPIALKHSEIEGTLESGSLVMLVAFGVGHSWAATLLRWAH